MVIVREAWSPAATPGPIPLVASSALGLHDYPVVGQIFADISLFNSVDSALFEAGALPESAVRRLALNSVLVDTGATHLCLPQDVVDAMGFRPLRRVLVATAAMDLETQIYGDVTIQIDGREAQAEVLALPVGRPPLLGVIPMEQLGMRLDMQSQVIEFRPNHGPDNYIRA